MILVDIGNSGLRAVKVSNDHSLSLDNVWRLSWPADLSVQGKRVPHQQSGPQQKWCEVDNVEAFDWLVNMLKAKSDEQWIVSSVKQRALEQLATAVQKSFGDFGLRTISYRDLEMTIDVEAPHRVGIDRLLAGWEAWHQVNPSGSLPSSVIVVQAGTAVTVDLVLKDRTFCGGSIMPGLGLALQLLAAGTDQLPWLENQSINEKPPLPGKSTYQAIAAGVHGALAGGASFLVKRYREEQRDDSLPVVVTGGDSFVIAPYIPSPMIPLEHLVLRALYRLSQSATNYTWT
jgi:type III pantothenate kinase